VRLDHLLSKERLAALSSRVAITRQTRSGLVAPKSITGYSIGSIGHRLVPPTVSAAGCWNGGAVRWPGRTHC
jgi:hypothetical protein